MVLSNAENKREWRERNNALAAVGRAHLAGRPRDVLRPCACAHIVLRKLWPRHRSRKACMLRTRRGGRARISYGPKVVRGGGEKMLKILDF